MNGSHPSDGTWKAGTASWWAISVVVAALAITAFTGLRTMHTVSERVPATLLLEAVLAAPTEAAIDDAMRSADPDDTRVAARSDLVAFDVLIADIRDDRSATINSAVEDRAAALYDDGIPADPGPSRTVVGLPRRLVSGLSADNRNALADAVRLAGILSLALLGWTLLQGRNDNLLMLPAGALATAWVLTTALQNSIDLFLGDIAPGSRRAVQIVETSAAQPTSQLAFATASALAAAAVYRFLVLMQHRSARRRAAREANVDTLPDEAQPIPDETNSDDAVIDLMAPDTVALRPDRMLRVRRREPLRADTGRNAVAPTGRTINAR